MYRRGRREREGREAGKGCIVAGEGEISGEGKGPFHPSSGEAKREKRGGKGAKKCISLRDKAVRFWAEPLGESAVLFS